MVRKNLLLSLLFALLAVAVQAQDMPVKFSVEQKQVSPTEFDVVFTGKIDRGWHVYSTNLPEDGPVPATLNTETSEGVKTKGALKAQGKEISEYDQIFSMQLRYFENTVTFVQRFEITAKTYHVKGYLEYAACNDQNCIPPTAVEFDFKGEGPATQAKSAEEPAKTVTDENAGKTSAEDPATAVTEPSDSTGVAAATALADGPSAPADQLWTPVIDQLQEQNGNDGTDRSWIYIFFLGFVGGLLALFTPCVWPIIPMTVSFFLKRTKDKRQGLRDAITYGVAIVVIYVTLGLLITMLFGANKLNDLSTNAIFNILFFLLLVVFALSFFGWFEIRLPSKWSNSVDSKASSTSGLLSIFLMAFTLSLVSFSCTGPIIGFLLVEVSTQGSIFGPAIGMLGFAIALALPFSLFALFPAWLKQAPKSGSWMNIIKVSLGFIELAFALKFFSVADLAYGWHLLDREVFLSLWIVIFGMLGLYLIGKLKFQSDMGETKAMPVPCIMLGLVSLAFAVYMVPGLWGAPCKAVSAFAPPMNTQDFNLNSKEVHAQYTNYEQGMAAARALGKPVMVDFTGFGCVNCRKMEAAVWTDPRVADLLTKDYVLISLFVDDKTPLPEKEEVVINGQKRTLRTIGDRWSYLQQVKFGSIAQPVYVCLDNEGNSLSGSFSYKEDIPAYVDFLKRGLDNYHKGSKQAE